ncbi:hypothetical protein BJ684DRAFT_18186 [Piptocephalis cylindrospora]|uniref:Protein kinase domain-containing protein n=1 Tax=Piptocephalis cylindrospora TaxID=1907219 RepID=A0A4P9Y9J7_9FUNG|nr:hypothetical protein BJ684DRAFT_18186 [Piptocephalis cylindrospora]|eukprot:RKP15482.1 hypothetical protein BJ684DRAFT_18186 [Piptocephalis cylindrospora]
MIPGLVHGDIKPRNVMLFDASILSPGMWKIIDFDAASEFDALVDAATPPYCAPEIVQASCEDSTILAHPSQDVYSLGMLLKRMYLGPTFNVDEEPPLPGSSTFEKQGLKTFGMEQMRESKSRMNGHPPTRNMISRMTQEASKNRISLDDVLGYRLIVRELNLILPGWGNWIREGGAMNSGACMPYRSPFHDLSIYCAYFGRGIGPGEVGRKDILASLVATQMSQFHHGLRLSLSNGAATWEDDVEGVIKALEETGLGEKDWMSGYGETFLDTQGGQGVPGALFFKGRTLPESRVPWWQVI